MKKVLSLCIVMTLLISYLPSCLVWANSNDNETLYCSCGQSIAVANLENDDELFLIENYATYYFSNLINNFGNNTHGSCTQIAFAMILSFYDTYWNDSFIPEEYDATTEISDSSNLLSVESPGIFYEPDELVSGLSMNDYKNVIHQYSSVYFHLKLLEIDLELRPSISTSFGMNMTELHDLMEEYMYGQNYLNETADSLPYEYVSNDERTYIIEQIKSGVPVIIRMGSASGDGGHAMVAYDYDEANDEIYVHAGWLGYSHVKRSDLLYSVYWDVTQIDINNINHVCSNNFVFTDSAGNQTTPCLCQKLAIHPEHEHSLSDTITESTHASTCEMCGYVSETEPHMFRYMNDGLSAGHTATCIGCGYSFSEFHTWITVGAKYRCSGCGVTSTQVPVLPFALSPEILAKIEQMGYVGDFAMDIGDGTVLCRIGDQYYLVAGQTEDTALQHLQNELSVVIPDREAA